MSTIPDTVSGPVRLRLAPSPTGFLHIGSAFLALLDVAFAKQHRGQFILRIEDTDQKRFVAEAEEAIYDGLRWLGLEWSEGPDVGGDYGPYRQSERLPLYQAAAEELVKMGRAYYCWCSPERLDQMRREQQARKLPPKYDRLCLGKTEAERKQLPGYTERPVVRLLMPSEGQTTIDDLIRGPITIENALIQDTVILKSDGYPTYHLAAPYDDHAMRITHITRGEEWISSTPIHWQIFDAFGWEPPAIAHTPLLINADRSKISKRKHPWAKVSWFRDEGYLPEAVINYLGSLMVHVPDPNNPDPSIDRDIFGLDDIVRHFDLGRVDPSGKIVDLDKLNWLNGHSIRALEIGELIDKVRPFLETARLHVAGDPKLAPALALEQERIKRLKEAPEAVSFFFRDEDYDAKLLVPRGADANRALELLRASMQTVEEVAAGETGWKAPALEAAFRALAERLGLKTGKERGQLIGAGVMRVAVTGRTVGPPLFETMEILGADTVRRRMQAALEMLAGLASGAQRSAVR
ncbi:MAG: glutamate--tRNA ligase [Chloroflexi bacterium]|nr:glutamate--tRNA ligase [Chloroflexota bacterium]